MGNKCFDIFLQPIVPIQIEDTQATLALISPALQQHMLNVLGQVCYNQIRVNSFCIHLIASKINWGLTFRGGLFWNNFCTRACV